MNDYQDGQKKNVRPVSFQPPTGGPGTSWYDWALNFYDRAYRAAAELTPELIDQLKDDFSWRELGEASKAGARYDRETGCFLLPNVKGVRDGKA